MAEEFTKLAILRSYFDSWLKQDATVLAQVFASTIQYVECYGPAYSGLAQVQQWFADWNRQGRVLRWDIKHSVEQGNMLACEWYFECEYMGNVDGFDGVTIAVFDQTGKISELREFQSKPQHHYPYGEG